MQCGDFQANRPAPGSREESADRLVEQAGGIQVEEVVMDASTSRVLPIIFDNSLASALSSVLSRPLLLSASSSLLRAASSIPVLMLTARGDEVDRIVGLEMGADDYLPKPFNPRELVARLRSIRRRTEHLSRSTERSSTAKLNVGDIGLEELVKIVEEARNGEKARSSNRRIV